ncbi:MULTISPECIES: hypothetical protein [Cyanophyceae]|uniref:hypothetical protein n=1 Tax=Cyanophyceae TaxID=3028117 RepID=UPI0016888A86|nr:MULTISPECIES: hypothetical protein [Cyanophyceae]MBD1919046.1 hypothetical protein [Phormidium sp. FACHB-77]MBD2028961.1 hypothetical protein [Phormidium sp. FACHB-322]MBD2053980.1 hypothetical protein [Leptolyngbya sp. FACHB-60]
MPGGLGFAPLAHFGKAEAVEKSILLGRLCPTSPSFDRGEPGTDGQSIELVQRSELTRTIA